MPLMTKFHCNDCGGEDLIFHAIAKWDGIRFDLREVKLTTAYCKICQKESQIFKSEEFVFEEKPKSNFNPIIKTGDL